MEKAQQYYMQLQQIQQHVEELQKNIQAIDEQKDQMQETLATLSELKNLEGKKELLTPLAQGIFMKSTTQKVDEVIINVGAGVLVKKDVTGAEEIITKQLTDMDTLQKDFLAKRDELAHQAHHVEEHLQKEIECLENSKTPSEKQ